MSIPAKFIDEKSPSFEQIQKLFSQIDKCDSFEVEPMEVLRKQLVEKLKDVYRNEDKNINDIVQYVQQKFMTRFHMTKSNS